MLQEEHIRLQNQYKITAAENDRLQKRHSTYQRIISQAPDLQTEKKQRADFQRILNEHKRTYELANRRVGILEQELEHLKSMDNPESNKQYIMQSFKILLYAIEVRELLDKESLAGQRGRISSITEALTSIETYEKKLTEEESKAKRIMEQMANSTEVRKDLIEKLYEITAQSQVYREKLQYVCQDGIKGVKEYEDALKKYHDTLEHSSIIGLEKLLHEEKKFLTEIKESRLVPFESRPMRKKQLKEFVKSEVGKRTTGGDKDAAVSIESYGTKFLKETDAILSSSMRNMPDKLTSLQRTFAAPSTSKTTTTTTTTTTNTIPTQEMYNEALTKGYDRLLSNNDPKSSPPPPQATNFQAVTRSPVTPVTPGIISGIPNVFGSNTTKRAWIDASKPSDGSSNYDV